MLAGIALSIWIIGSILTIIGCAMTEQALYTQNIDKTECSLQIIFDKGGDDK